MHEISPVLAGTFDQAGYMPAKVNFNIANLTSGDTAAPAAADAANDASGIDPRRYTQFDRSATEAGSTTTFSFSDLLDLINPLEHVPVLSSIYREVTGETINPVSRVAGDTLYGGIIGMASAVIGGVGAIGDSVMEAQTGKDSTGTVVATLFEDPKMQDPEQKIELASAAPNPSNTVLSPIAASPTQPLAPQQTNAAQIASSVVMDPTTTNGHTDSAPNLGAVNLASTGTPPQGNGKGFALDRSKLAYGGVMAPVGNTTPDQNMTMALAESSHAIRLGNTIYTNRLMNGPHPLPVASAPPVSSNTSAVATSMAAAAAAPTPSAFFAPLMSAAANAPQASSVTGQVPGLDFGGSQKNTIPQALADDMMMLKALNQYKSIGSASSTPGMTLDVTN